MYLLFFSRAKYTEPNFPFPSGLPMSKSSNCEHEREIHAKHTRQSIITPIVHHVRYDSSQTDAILCKIQTNRVRSTRSTDNKNSNSRAPRPLFFIDAPSTPWLPHRSRPPSTRLSRVRSSPDRSTGSSRLDDAHPRSLFPDQRSVDVVVASTRLSRPANRASTSRPSCANRRNDRNNYFPSVARVLKSTARAS